MTSTLTASLTLTRPDDWHLHVRDGAALKTVVPHTAAQFGRAIIMPNLKPPVTTAELALAYKARIVAAVPKGVQFEPLMTLYLTDNLPPEEIVKAKAAGVVACKLYPAGATTNSDAGVTDLKKIYPTLEAMQKAGMLLLVHGEVTSSDIDLFDREAAFIETQLIPLRRDFPELKIVFEHITTKDAADYVMSADRFVGATLTAHHLLYNRNAIFTGGIRPHYYCLPVLKRETHRVALLNAATSGNARFFLGTDSAPHPAHLKEHAIRMCRGATPHMLHWKCTQKPLTAWASWTSSKPLPVSMAPIFMALPRNTGQHHPQARVLDTLPKVSSLAKLN
jgi:dihydroorotase